MALTGVWGPLRARRPITKLRNNAMLDKTFYLKSISSIFTLLMVILRRRRQRRKISLGLAFRFRLRFRKDKNNFICAFIITLLFLLINSKLVISKYMSTS